MLVKSPKLAEESYHKQLFDDTQQTAQNLWEHLGPIINSNTKKVIDRALIRFYIMGNTSSIIKHRYVTRWMNICVKWEKNYIKCWTVVVNCRVIARNQWLKHCFLSPTDQDELMVEIKKLNPKESCIPHDMRAKVIQIFPLNLAADVTKCTTIA